MKVSIKLASNLASLTENNKNIDYELSSRATIDHLIDLLDQQFPGFKSVVCTEQSEIADHINLYVNGDNIRYIGGLETELKEGDTINVIPAAAAG